MLVDLRAGFVIRTDQQTVTDRFLLSVRTRFKIH